MGYRRELKRYVLKFEDEEFSGFECVCGSLSVDEFLELNALAGEMMSSNPDVEEVGRLFNLLSEKIVRWNLEDDEGKPIAHGPEDLRAQDIDFIVAILMAWLDGMSVVPGPLPNDSSSGGTSLDAMTTELANMSRSRPS